MAAAAAVFDRGGWWDPACREFASLREVSAFRLALLQRWLPGTWHGRTVVDLGCGGGLLGVPMAAAGARVVGIDLARAALRAGLQRGEPCYLPVAGLLEQAPLAAGSADVVLLADVLEHVEHPALAVAEAARLLKPSGQLFVNTIARTRRSRWLAIALGEGLGFVPRGTHEWHRFVAPAELDAMAAAAGLRRHQRTGETPRLFATLRQRAIVLRECHSLAVGYAVLYQPTVGTVQATASPPSGTNHR